MLDAKADALAPDPEVPLEALLAVAAADLLGLARDAVAARATPRGGAARPDPWTALAGWRAVGEERAP
jgi:hypothetical protein